MNKLKKEIKRKTLLMGSIVNIGDMSMSTVYRYVNKLWIKRCGDRFILTDWGYNDN